MWKDYKSYSSLLSLAIEHQQHCILQPCTQSLHLTQYHIVWKMESFHILDCAVDFKEQHNINFANTHFLQVLHKHCDHSIIQTLTNCSKLTNSFGTSLLKAKPMIFTSAVEIILKLELPTVYHGMCTNRNFSLQTWIDGWINNFFFGTLQTHQIETILLPLILKEGVCFLSYLIVCMVKWLHQRAQQTSPNREYCCEWCLGIEVVEMDWVTTLEQIYLEREWLWNEFTISNHCIEEMQFYHSKYYKKFIHILEAIDLD